jgi:hypothetical protein
MTWKRAFHRIAWVAGLALFLLGVGWLHKWNAEKRGLRSKDTAPCIQQAFGGRQSTISASKPRPIAWRTTTACGSLRPTKHSVSSIVASGLRITDIRLASTLALGSVGHENKTDEEGRRLIWLDRPAVDRLRSLRGPGESYKRRHSADRRTRG